MNIENQVTEKENLTNATHSIPANEWKRSNMHLNEALEKIFYSCSKYLQFQFLECINHPHLIQPFMKTNLERCQSSYLVLLVWATRWFLQNREGRNKRRMIIAIKPIHIIVTFLANHLLRAREDVDFVFLKNTKSRPLRNKLKYK